MMTTELKTRIMKDVEYMKKESKNTELLCRIYIGVGVQLDDEIKETLIKVSEDTNIIVSEFRKVLFTAPKKHKIFIYSNFKKGYVCGGEQFQTDKKDENTLVFTIMHAGDCKKVYNKVYYLK
jgi:hypothetical protein